MEICTCLCYEYGNIRLQPKFNYNAIKICRNYKIEQCINEIIINKNKSGKLLEESNQNLLKLQNNKLTQKANEFNNNDISMKNIISNLKIKLEEVNIQNIKLRKQIEEYQEFISNYNNENKNNKNSEKNKILELVDNIMKKEKEIKEIKSRYPFELLKDEKMICLTFISFNEDIHYSIICKNTDKFSVVEGKFYEKYPEFMECENSFSFKGRKLNRFKTIEENHIYDNAIIYF